MEAGYLTATGPTGRLIYLSSISIDHRRRLVIMVLHVTIGYSDAGSRWFKGGVVVDSLCNCPETENGKDGMKPCEQLARANQDRAVRRESSSRPLMRLFTPKIRLK